MPRKINPKTTRTSALIDTQVIYCGGNLDQLASLPNDNRAATVVVPKAVGKLCQLNALPQLAVTAAEANCNQPRRPRSEQQGCYNGIEEDRWAVNAAVLTVSRNLQQIR